MKKKTRNIITISTIAAMIVAGAGLSAKHFVQKKAKANKQKTELRAQELQGNLRELNAEKAVLDSTYLVYSGKQSEYFLGAKNFKAENPSCDNMDSLYVLVGQVYNHVKQNYNQAESVFMAKLVKACKPLCRKDGKYGYIEEASTEYRKPEGLYDWLTVLYENIDNIPGSEALIAEYETLSDIDNLLYSFDGYISNKFFEYIDASEGQRDYEKRAIDEVVKHDTLRFENGYYLAQKEYLFMDGGDVYKRNTLDNINQDEILKVLYRDYLHQFKKYNSANCTIISDSMYRKVMDFMLQIRQHNDLEEGVVSYNAAMKEISVRKSEIDSTVAKIQRELAGQTR